MDRLPSRQLILLAAMMLAFCSVAGAQPAPPTETPAATESQAPAVSQADNDAEQDVISGELTTTPPAIFSVGVSAGFPSYQTVALTASLQAQYVGFQFKGSWTAAGPYLGGQIRAYPPVPIPVPVYVGVGGGVYGDNVSYHAAIGAHVPVGKNLRFDLEGGVANVPMLAERVWVPHLAAGVSYAFPVDLSARAAPEEPATAAVTPAPSSSCRVPSEPDASQLSGAVAGTVQDWLRSAQATFGSIYKDLRYSYRISSTKLDGLNAHVTVEYSGSVTEILTGERHSASGTASATYIWTGCRWGGGSVEY